MSNMRSEEEIRAMLKELTPQEEYKDGDIGFIIALKWVLNDD